MSAPKEKMVIDFLQLPRPEAKPVGKKAGVATKISPLRQRLLSRKPDGLSSVLKMEERTQGMKEVYKDLFKVRRAEDEKLSSLIGKSENILIRIRNIIPIFTDEIIIDTHKVTIINRPFFFSEHIQAISIKNVNDVFIQTVPFLATISIMDVGLPKSHMIHVKWFWKKDAEKARRIITGLMETTKENVDLKSLDELDLDKKLEELGKIRGARTSVSAA